MAESTYSLQDILRQNDAVVFDSSLFTRIYRQTWDGEESRVRFLFSDIRHEYQRDKYNEMLAAGQSQQAALAATGYRREWDKTKKTFGEQLSLFRENIQLLTDLEKVLVEPDNSQKVVITPETYRELCIICNNTSRHLNFLELDMLKYSQDRCKADSESNRVPRAPRAPFRLANEKYHSAMNLISHLLAQGTTAEELKKYSEFENIPDAILFRSSVIQLLFNEYTYLLTNIVHHISEGAYLSMHEDYFDAKQDLKVSVRKVVEFMEFQKTHPELAAGMQVSENSFMMSPEQNLPEENVLAALYYQAAKRRKSALVTDSELMIQNLFRCAYNKIFSDEIIRCPQLSETRWLENLINTPIQLYTITTITIGSGEYGASGTGASRTLFSKFSKKFETSPELRKDDTKPRAAEQQVLRREKYFSVSRMGSERTEIAKRIITDSLAGIQKKLESEHSLVRDRYDQSGIALGLKRFSKSKLSGQHRLQSTLLELNPAEIDAHEQYKQERKAVASGLKDNPHIKSAVSSLVRENLELTLIALHHISIPECFVSDGIENSFSQVCGHFMALAGLYTISAEFELNNKECIAEEFGKEQKRVQEEFTGLIGATTQKLTELVSNASGQLSSSSKADKADEILARSRKFIEVSDLLYQYVAAQKMLQQIPLGQDSGQSDSSKLDSSQ